MATHESGQSRASRSDKDEDVDTPDAPDAPSAEGTERREKLGEDVDAMLDEIDDVLETNAEDFVKSFVQKGGE